MCSQSSEGKPIFITSAVRTHAKATVLGMEKMMDLRTMYDEGDCLGFMPVFKDEETAKRYYPEAGVIEGMIRPVEGDD